MLKGSNNKLGTWVYTRALLKVYDLIVLKGFGRYIWRCNAQNFVDHYHNNLSNNHAEFGVGTAYCLDQCRVYSSPRIALFDINANCLAFATQRLAGLRPEAYIQNVLLPTTHSVPTFDSLALGGILHCLPGTMAEKCKAFDLTLPLLNKGARVFGYSLLSNGTSSSPLSHFLLDLLNAFNVINNHKDSLVQLRCELKKRYINCEVFTIGQLAFFTATVK